ncbi:MAG TPA: VanZ family protein [Casimicrobiaceae bacterium]|nr:VanZ family protein [Casimicrobiaceae bacterium]
MIEAASALVQRAGAHGARQRTVLPHYLALIYGLAIAYASLQPFGPWIAPPAGTPFFLFAATAPRFTRFDVLANALSYVPFGFFMALVPRVMRPWTRFALAVASGFGLSFAMESLQMLLPPRDASVVDLVSNSVGAALGGGLGVAFATSPAAKQAVSSARHRWFLAGKVGDLGLALLVLWLVVQVNPGIPLFASVFDPAIELPALPGVNPAGMQADAAAAVVEGAHSALQLLGVGLFLALLLRQRRFVGAAMLLLIMTAVLVKLVAAALLLHPVVFERWLRPGAAMGVAFGTLLLMIAVWLPRPAQVAMATVALLASLLATLLAPELIFTRAPLALFNWSYGHLLSFNGLTHTVLLVWPLAACAFLFTLAGRPRWGDPN